MPLTRLEEALQALTLMDHVVGQVKATREDHDRLSAGKAQIELLLRGSTETALSAGIEKVFRSTAQSLREDDTLSDDERKLISQRLVKVADALRVEFSIARRAKEDS